MIARHSAFLFKDRDLPSSQIAGQLGVRYLMTGGLQRLGRKLRLRVQLTEAETDRVIWSDRYDGDLGDLFAFQDDVTAMIAARLAVQISAAEQRRLLAENPPELRAYGLFLRGQDLYLRDSAGNEPPCAAPVRRGGARRSQLRAQLRRLVPDVQGSLALRWTDTPELCLEQAVDAGAALDRARPVRRARPCRPSASPAFQTRHDESLAAYQRATSSIRTMPTSSPRLARAHHRAATRSERLELLQRAMRLNPFYPDWYLWYLGEAYFDLGDYEEVDPDAQQNA